MKIRGKGKIGKCLGLKDSYKEYHKARNKNSQFPVDYSLYKKICADFNKKIVEHILEDSGTFKLPHRLGEIRIQKRKMNFNKPNKLMVDWKKTNELGTRIYHLNDHSDNFRYRWYWRKNKAIIKNKSAYSFTATRDNMRALAKNILTRKDVDYFE